MEITNINKQTKSEIGMNRNDFYEYKKNRVIDMAKNGASVSDMANDLGVDEKDMYAFLSRNFGGIRKLKQMANSGEPVPQLQMASMTTEVDKKEKKTAKSTSTKKKVQNSKTEESVLSAFNNVLSNEKNKILTEFKQGIEKDAQSIVNEVQTGLNRVREEMLTKFKNDIMSGLSTMAQTL